MRLLTLELRLVAWLVMATVAFLLLAWTVRYAPWALVLPVWGHRRRWRAWRLRRAAGRGELA